MSNSNNPEPEQEGPQASSPGVASKLEIMSYGHSNGPLIPPTGASQLTFSVRDIENPPAKLRRKHTGLSARLRKEIMANKSAAARLDHIRTAVEAKMSELAVANQSWLLIVGIMCEEGKHRSVTFAEELARRIAVPGWDVSVHHRDLGMVDVDEDEALVSDGGGAQPFGRPKQTARPGSKKQRDRERKKGRSSAARFVGNPEEDDIE